MSTWFRSLEISASGLAAERLRMDVIANNIANAQTTRTAGGQPYRRRTVVLEERGEPTGPFAALLSRLSGALPAGVAPPVQAAVLGNGVRVSRILEDPRPFKLVYDPTHPDADAQGYVRMPNVDVLREMVDLISASRAYEANVTALNAAKSMALKALEIGR